MNRRRFIKQTGLASTIFLPLVSTGAAAPPTQAIYLAVPDFVNTLNLTNPQIIGDSAGVYWAATRASSDIGGVVWRVDGYVDRDHPGVITQVHPTDPARFFANGELIVWPNGYLYYVTVEVNNITERKILAQVAYPVPGWAP